MSTLHYEDSQVVIHKTVVGPYDNNVFVVRCRETGDSLLVDAANEHEQHLELCKTLGVRQIVETHGHGDPIQAIPQLRDAGYEVAVTAADAGMLPSYD
ncbi:MAG: MBL fold metallo-hydrolase, partial [Acidimicrobiales bacterium]